MIKFKTLPFVLTIILLASGCKSMISGEIEALQNQIDEIRRVVDNLNDDISSISEMLEEIESGQYLKSITDVKDGTVTIGYTLTFTDNRTIRISSILDDGASALLPSIGVKRDIDEVWYWTIDGEWLLNAEGNKIRASGAQGEQGDTGEKGTDGVTPLLKIDNDWWYISYDNGASWIILDKAKGDDGVNGTDGKSFFRNVEIGDDYVTLILADGSEIAIPIYRPLSISFSAMAVTMAAGSTFDITFELSGDTDNCSVFANTTSEDWMISVIRTSSTNGKITIQSPDFEDTTDMAVFVSDGTKTVMEVISLSSTKD